MSVREPGERFEVELPATWPPCSLCGARTRVAVAMLRRREIAVFCGGEPMHEVAWQPAGSVGRTNVRAAFLPGGPFAGLIPAHFLGAGEAGTLDRAYAIAERRADWIRTEQRACAGCGIPPMREWYDGGQLIEWLRDVDPVLFDDVAAAVATHRPPLNRGTWYAALVRSQFDLIARINARIEDSYLHPVRSIPAAVIAPRWARWSRSMRSAAVNTLAFGMCASCLHAQRDGLPARVELLRRHVTFNHDGSRAAAEADTARWRALTRVLDSIADAAESISARRAVR